MSMQVKRLVPNLIILDEVMSNPKVDVWDIEFRTPEGQPPIKGKMKSNPDNRKNIPQTGQPEWFGLEQVTTKAGENITAITWPALAQLRPAPVPGEVTKPIQNPVVSTAEGAAQAPAKEIPDAQPRRGVIKSIVKVDKDTFTPRDGQPQYKYLVVMTDGAQGVMWTPEQEPPAKVDQDLNYTFDKVYQDGSKRIAMAPIGSAVDKDTIILRIACMKAAVEYFSNSGNNPENPMLAMTLQAERWEQWIMRSAE